MGRGNDDGRRERPAERRRPQRALVWLILALLPLAIFWQVRGFDFVNFDDVDYVYGNSRVQAGLSWDNVRWAFVTTQASNWHPLVWLSLMLDARLWGIGAGGFHLVNALLHGVVGLLLFVVMNRMTGAWWRSAVVAALFAVHPLHVESVAWISARKDLLSALFGLLALLCYAEYARRPRAWSYGCALAGYAGSLMSKQMLVTLPFLLLLLDYWPLARFQSRPGEWRRLWLEKLPFFVLAAVFGVVALLAQQHGGSVASLDRWPLGPRIANALVAYVLYLRQAVWPQGLACFYPYPTTGTSAPTVVGCIVSLGLITAASLAQARRRPYLPVGWLWFLGSLVPVIGLVQIGAQRMADRYTYWPLTGLCIALVWLVPSPARDRRRALLALATAGLVVAFAVVAWRQTGTWRDTTTVWKRALAVTRNNYRAHNNLGAALGAVGRHDEAAYHFGKALEAEPEYASAHVNLGKVLDLQGRFEEAVAHFRRALEIDPKLASARINWAIALSRRRRFDEAILQFRAAIEADPDEPGVLRLLVEAHEAHGLSLVHQGRRVEAAAQFREALRLDPDSATAREQLDPRRD